MTAVLDLHDTALKIWQGDDEIASPGYAWFDGSRLRFGLPALRTQRRTPREVNTRFWSQLGTAPLSPALGKARHTADLAHQHLQELYEAAGRPDSVLLAVSGSLSRDQLSLLLGIIEHLPFSVAGLVHRSALLASASHLEQGFHVELQLHQSLVTRFDSEGAQVVVSGSQALPGEGLLALQDRLATVIAGAFVAQTRFDPLRSADTEQALYDQLPDALTTLEERGEAHVGINGYDARVTQDDLASIGAAYTQALAPLLDAESPLLLEAPLDRLPGLATGRAANRIDNSTLAATALQFIAQLKQSPDNLTLQRRVPRDPQSASSLTDQNPQPPTPEQQAGQRPSHWLSAGVAKPLSNAALSDRGIVLTDIDQGLVLAGPVPRDLTVNGRPADAGQVLCAGDVIADDLGFHTQLIAVEE